MMHPQTIEVATNTAQCENKGDRFLNHELMTPERTPRLSNHLESEFRLSSGLDSSRKGCDSSILFEQLVKA